jgi:hypothetical protein
VRDVLAWLHERLYPEIRVRRWDIYFRTGWSLTPALLTERTPLIQSIELRYVKSETALRLMQKRFAAPELGWDDTGWLGLRADPRGLAILFELGARARLDALNLYDKVTRGAPEKRALRQMFAELGGDFTLVVDRQGEAHPIRCSRLVDLRILNGIIDNLTPGVDALRVETLVVADSPELDGAVAPEMVLRRLEALYPLYQFAGWSPRNNFIAAARDQSQPGISN